MGTIEKSTAQRKHLGPNDWIPAVPLAITIVVCVLSLNGLYKTWLEPVGLHLWMEEMFPRGFSGFDRFTDDPVRYKIIFSWIVVVASASGLLVGLASIRVVYRHVLSFPRLYIFAVCGYFLLIFFLLIYHGSSRPDWSPSRSIRSLFYTGLYSFGFWSVGLSLTAYYAWTGFFAGIFFTVRRLLSAED